MSFECMTNGEANDQLLYFTSPSISEDGNLLFYISDADGNANVWVKNLKTGDIGRISDNTTGILKSYVYFRGLPYQGLGKASVSLDVKAKVVYYIQGRNIIKANANGNRSVLTGLPGDEMTAFTHVSADGRYLCVPTVDARALDGDRPIPGNTSDTGPLDYDIDKRVRQEGLSSYINVYDTCTGQLVKRVQVKGGWVTHVQFSPIDSSLILYNHEYVTDGCGVRRMWLFDGENHIPLRTEGEGRSRDDWTCHEMWQADGHHIIYHGTHHNGTPYIGRVLPTGKDNVEIPFPAAYNKYGHFTSGTKDPNLLVTDGCFCYGDQGDNASHCGRYISVLQVDWDKKAVEWKVLCESLSSWNSQDSHPHPVFAHADKYVYFTSDHGGKRRVCRVLCRP